MGVSPKTTSFTKKSWIDVMTFNEEAVEVFKKSSLNELIDIIQENNRAKLLLYASKYDINDAVELYLVNIAKERLGIK